MPEGDSLVRVARRLGPALVGAELREIEAPRWAGPRPRSGETIDSVEAVGKWLVISFSGGLVLLNHLRMNGRWQLYGRGERWQRSRSAMRLRIATDSVEAVCFAAPIVEFHTPSSAKRRLGHLGPDLSEAEVDFDLCLERFALLEPHVTIAEALLDQRIAAGIGNVYKSEVCWFERVDPFANALSLEAPTRLALLQRAHRLLRANLGGGPRRTVPGGLAVYGRRSKPCRRCGSPIASKVHTEHARRTYWCPTCQQSSTDNGTDTGSVDT